MDFLAPPPSRQHPPYLQRWTRLQPLASQPCQWSCHLSHSISHVPDGGSTSPHLLLPVVLCFKWLPPLPYTHLLPLLPLPHTPLCHGSPLRSLGASCPAMVSWPLTEYSETLLNGPWMDLVDLFCFTCRRSFTCCLSFKYVGQLKAELGELLCLEGWIKPVTLSCCYSVYTVYYTLLDTNQGYITISENS